MEEAEFPFWVRLTPTAAQWTQHPSRCLPPVPAGWDMIPVPSGHCHRHPGKHQQPRAGRAGPELEPGCVSRTSSLAQEARGTSLPQSRPLPAAPAQPKATFWGEVGQERRSCSFSCGGQPQPPPWELTSLGDRDQSRCLKVIRFHPAGNSQRGSLFMALFPPREQRKSLFENRRQHPSPW